MVNEVCEWRKNWYAFETSCGYAYVKKGKLEYEFCPHCHKPIKVVE